MGLLAGRERSTGALVCVKTAYELAWALPSNTTPADLLKSWAGGAGQVRPVQQRTSRGSSGSGCGRNTLWAPPGSGSYYWGPHCCCCCCWTRPWGTAKLNLCTECDLERSFYVVRRGGTLFLDFAGLAVSRPVTSAADATQLKSPHKGGNSRFHGASVALI
ncbi:unnamed protein product [Boreogadus saida]